MILLWLQFIPFAGGLSPYERFEAMRQLDTNQQSGLYDLLTNKWFILMGWSVIVVLMLILAAIRQQRKEKEKRDYFRIFSEKSDLFGLTEEEQEIMYSIAQCSRLKRFHLIYFQPKDFEIGSDRFLRKHVLTHPDEAFKKQQVESVESIKYKVGFVKREISYVGRYRRGRDLTSRQIPVGSEVTIVFNQSLPEARCKAEVISNEMAGLGFVSSEPLSFQSGEVCTIHYVIGSVIWGFDMIVLGCEANKIEVCHVDHARYINRRRFVRVPLDQSAWIAPFPVLRKDTDSMRPSFVKADIIEFSGPTLKIRGVQDLIRKDRLLLIFEVEPGHVVQDIAEVRRVGQTDSDSFYVVELIGLDDRSEDELIRITNRVAFDKGLIPSEEYEADFDETSENEIMDNVAEVNA